MSVFKTLRRNIQVTRYKLHNAVCNGAVSKNEYIKHSKNYTTMVKFIDTLYRLDIL